MRSTTHRRRTATALVLSLALVAAACGGDGDDDAAAPVTTEAGAPTTEPAPDTEQPDDGAPDTEQPDDGGPDTEAPDIGGETEAPAGDPSSELAALCPVGALDDAAGPVPLEFWHSMTVELEEALRGLVTDYNA
ncbi:hypothetical protein BH23ACT3_BH23ACT3_12370 [soil metagenome]